MQLIQMPPEIIVMIYDSLDIKSKIKLSRTNTYIYDCRPVDEIEYCKWKSAHSKNMKPVINSINSIKYIIVEWVTSEYDRATYRLIGNMESMYRYSGLRQSLYCFKQENFWAESQYSYRVYSKFGYGSFTLGKKVRHTEVDMQKTYANVYIRIR
jgi:hypothetical protein